MHRSLLVFDIETVPCIETARKLLHLDNSIEDSTVIQKLIDYHIQTTNNPFPRQPFHKIVCISFLLCEIEKLETGESYTIKEIKTGGRNGESEAEILEKFCNFLEKHRPRVVSFNGKTFDMPVIQYRSMLHRIPFKWSYSKDMSYKYNHEPHCDLIDAFSNFGSSARIKMSEVCALLDIPAKKSGQGNEVLEMYDNQEIDKICNYCQEDVLCTYMLYLYHQMHKGVLSVDVFARLLEKAKEKLA